MLAIPYFGGKQAGVPNSFLQLFSLKIQEIRKLNHRTLDCYFTKEMDSDIIDISDLESFVKATDLNPFGSLTTASSWLIQTAALEVKKFLVSKDWLFLNIKALPNSLRFFDDLIFPPNSFAISCKP